MTRPLSVCHIFETNALIPPSWQHFAEQGPVRAFNPGLLQDGDNWIFAFRLVTPEGARRIGLCRLSPRLEVIAGSHLPLSDLIHFRAKTLYPTVATHWFADPRLYRFAGRVFIYWNSGWHEPRNYQFLQELDPASLQPKGAARELILNGERRKLEKNWTLFDAGASDHYFAVYSILPHRILQFSMAGEADILLSPCASSDWALAEYPATHGGLRGGAPPCRVDDVFWNFCHSVHDAPGGYRYSAAVYSFASSPPFEPTTQPIRPLPSDFGSIQPRAYERLNSAVGEVIYPCGAAWSQDRWLVSHGVNDEVCAITTYSHDDVQATLRSHPPTSALQ